MNQDFSVSDWLPTTKKEAALREWDDFDVILISGDAYVDHPAFGAAVIGRILEDMGLRVGIIDQPNWKGDLQDFKRLGTPNLFFGVTGGCMDPMVNHYTANKKRRSNDAYTPGGKAGRRPDYATSTYTKILKELFPDVPVLIGGIEASLRRVTHYDYWSNKLQPNILSWSGADMLVYGMGEQALREIVRLVQRGVPFESLKTVAQTAVLVDNWNVPKNKKINDIILNSHEDCLKDKLKYAANFKHVEQESNKVKADRLLQDIGDKTLVINPPYPTMTEKEIDQSFDLPYTRMPHPKYQFQGPIPSYDMIRHSINMHRGCFGGCSFCTISAHQGKFVASRSKDSVMKEVEKVVNMPDFKGYISDLGGPSANMYGMKGIDQSICDRCTSPSCINPVICSNLDTSHKKLTDLYKEVDKHEKVKKAFVGSGVRYDMVVKSFNKNGDESMNEYMEQLITRHVSGRLKVAPEHTSSETLKLMRKPDFKHFHEFKNQFDKIQKKHDLNQQLIPYFISSHPGCKPEDMADLAVETKEMGFQLEQVQDFTPTPMTVATVIYYAGVHPYTMKPYYTAKSKKEKQEQNKFFFWYKRENHQWIKNTLEKAKRFDLLKRLIQRPDEEKRIEKSTKKSFKKNHGFQKNKFKGKGRRR